MKNVIDEIKENMEKGEEVIEKIEDKIKEVVKEKMPKKDSNEESDSKDKPAEETGELAVKAEAESTIGEKSIQEKKKELLEKAAKLKEKLTEAPKTEELKEKVKVKKRTDMLIPLEEYVKSGIYLGTRVVTPNMKPFVYRRRADGLAIFNTDIIDERLKEAIEYLSQFEPENVILVCKRQAGWRTAEMFSQITGIRVFLKKYPAGILTNTSLPDFFENELTIICDSWLDKNALHDTINVQKNVLMVCDTNNFSKGADKIIIGNNKSAKSLGLIFYLLARGYCKARKIDANIPDMEWWTSEDAKEVSEKVQEK